MEVVGQDLNGAPVHRIALRRGGTSAKILSYGAVLQDFRIAGGQHSLVLGYPELAPYFTDENYFGATVGRVVNRIRDGLAVVDGVRYQLDQNLPEGHHLHGGSEGTARRCWRVVEHSQTNVILEVVLPDGHMGYPGTLVVQVCFSLLAENTLSIEITADSTATTLCNFAHHSYFNLGHERTITGHLLEVSADRYLVIDGNGVPTGEVRNVTDTEFDFRDGRRLIEGERYDHNLCLAQNPRALQKVARLSCPDGRTHMEIATTEVGLQTYTGHGIKTGQVGADQKGHGPFSGIALEPQGWVDAPNQPDFPSVILPIGQKYHQKTIFQFFHQSRAGYRQISGLVT
jgi:aldose 1-epimerase